MCDINIKKPVSKSGFLTIAKLREKIIDIFNNSKSDIDYTLVKRYDDIIPPANSETYDISKLIIASTFVISIPKDFTSIRNASVINSNAPFEAE